MSHRYRPSSKCLRARKKKHIWVTYLHNNVAPSIKQLRFGASGGQRCTCAPSSLREPFILFIYLCISALPVNSGRSVNVVGRQLYAFHQCCWHWPAQHRQAGLKRAGVSTSLNPAYSRWIFTASISSKLNAHFLISDHILRAMLMQLLSIV